MGRPLNKNRPPPPPGPPGLGPVEAAIAAEVRAHTHPITAFWLLARLPDIDRRAVHHHLGRLVGMGVVDRVPLTGAVGYQWRPDVRSVWDDLGPTATCPRCGTDASG